MDEPTNLHPVFKSQILLENLGAETRTLWRLFGVTGSHLDDWKAKGTAAAYKDRKDVFLDRVVGGRNFLLDSCRAAEEQRQSDKNVEKWTPSEEFEQFSVKRVNEFRAAGKTLGFDGTPLTLKDLRNTKYWPDWVLPMVCRLVAGIRSADTPTWNEIAGPVFEQLDDELGNLKQVSARVTCQRKYQNDKPDVPQAVMAHLLYTLRVNAEDWCIKRGQDHWYWCLKKEFREIVARATYKNLQVKKERPSPDFEVLAVQLPDRGVPRQKPTILFPKNLTRTERIVLLLRYRWDLSIAAIDDHLDRIRGLEESKESASKILKSAHKKVLAANPGLEDELA